MISIKQLNYALAVEKTLHFKRAAELCHVSQSALSTALSALEKNLGLHIFERDNRKVLVTPQGKEVLRRAQDIMLRVEDLEHFVDNQKAPLSFPLSVGFIPTIAPYLLPKIFQVLYEHFPDAQINIVEDQSDQLVNLVRVGDLDTAIIALPYPCQGLLEIEFWQEDFYWITTKGNSLAHKKEITSEEIVHSKLKLMLLKEGHCLKDHILDICKLTGDRSDLGFGATSLNTLIQMVQSNQGSTLVPAMALQQLIEKDNHLSAVHLNEPSPHRRIGCIARPNYTRLSSIEALAEICRKALNNN